MTAENSGYRHGMAFGTKIRANRAAWAITHGYWPNLVIDHINQNSLDDRLENLREVSKSENARNARLPSDNTSGVIGVSFCKKSGSWRAYINARSELLNLGFFRDKSDAILARRNAEIEMGYSVNHGSSASRPARIRALKR